MIVYEWVLDDDEENNLENITLLPLLYRMRDGKFYHLSNHGLLLIIFSAWYVRTMSGRQGHASGSYGCLIYSLNSGDVVSSQNETRGLMSTVHPNPFSDVNGNGVLIFTQTDWSRCPDELRNIVIIHHK